MPKMLIVDDDAHIRAGLTQLIDWENLGIEIIAEAGGGHEALAIFERTAPQIVLTDIRMAEGDGLELIERIRERGWHTHIIVLSGYDDYTYVRQAMKYQVEDYLLKPVEAEELEEIAKSCVAQIEHRWLEEQVRRETFQLLRNNVLNRWVENRIGEEPLREKLDFLKIGVGRTRLFQAAVIGWKDAAEPEPSEAERNYRSFAIFNVMDELLSEHRRGVAFLNGEQQVVCLLFGEAGSADAFADDNLAWLRANAEQCASMLKTPWHCALGKPVNRLPLVHASYRDAVRLLDGMEQTGGVHCADRRAALSDSPAAALAEHERLIPALLSGARTLWEQALEGDFQWALGQSDPLAAAKYAASEWIATAKQAIRERHGDTARPRLPEELLSSIFAATSVPAIRQAVNRLLEAASGGERPTETKNKLTIEAERYVEEHFREDLSLQTVADRLHASSIYLGRLFKAETGEYFNDRLNRLRIDEARRLLRETRLTASEIAARCGFADANYFFRKFKQKVGMSPTDYRKTVAPPP
ncbi:response regulator transcription factor [Paenibacillus cisolokensis]|uniref:response regulator transcription factor n=1 Tax=Paenibacillus cisolokensis TaxID=1658519 RepID=UPI003D2C5EF2